MRYTAVFEFETGYEPSVGIKDGWLGGDLCAVQFNDALLEIERLQNQVAAAKEVISRGVDLMTTEQLGQWTGVRSFLEQETIDYAPADLLANAPLHRDAEGGSGASGG